MFANYSVVNGQVSDADTGCAAVCTAAVTAVAVPRHGSDSLAALSCTPLLPC